MKTQYRIYHSPPICYFQAKPEIRNQANGHELQTPISISMLLIQVEVQRWVSNALLPNWKFYDTKKIPSKFEKPNPIESLGEWYIRFELFQISIL